MGSNEGVIIKAIAGFYYVQLKENIYECKALGKFRKDGILPLVGDKVTLELNYGSYSVIKEIRKRKNHLIRPPVANIDNLIIVVSTIDPAPNIKILDQLIAVATYNDINPVVVISKTDLNGADDLFDTYNSTGIKTILFSKFDGAGIEQIKNVLSNSTSAFTGNTGVGKSTILNCIDSNFKLQTGVTSKKLGRGKHTTRHVELLKLHFGGFVADTPGFSSIDLGRYNMIKKEELAENFIEFRPFLNKCKFTSCTHMCERGCAVIKAVNGGLISQSRYNSYISMYNDIKSIKIWEK